MGSKRRSTTKAGTSSQKRTFKEVVKVEQRLETKKVKGNLFFPCKTCNRLFKKENEATEHSQACNFQTSNGSISSGVKAKDKMNNNYMPSNEAKKCRRNSERLRKNATRCNNYISVPKKKTIKNSKSNVELNNHPNKEKSDLQPCATIENDKKDVAETPVKSRRRGKKLSEEEIAERLKAISEKLKKTSEVKVPYDEQEEEERQEIEDKLMALNKDSEISYLDDYPDFDDRLKDEDESLVMNTESIVNLEKGHGVVNNPNINSSGQPNSSIGQHTTIIVTQKPDGQLHGCPRCPEVFVSELELFRHKRAKHTAPKIIMALSEVKKFYDVPDRSHCPICKRVFNSSNKTIYIKHLQSHSYIGEYACPVCKKNFKRKDHMRMHQKRHIV
ncbi:PR domain zinc finger protein 15-like [Coccinella septempunctata]|uniref:PR domain zinc finger protein 15-like n=1 Tax=Coccinella septempunctata TaxID=41139 RepID=UPI001D06E522|nr:PR domain zinc finger protein 15-like [Coccinella septempunctata]